MAGACKYNQTQASVHESGTGCLNYFRVLVPVEPAAFFSLSFIEYKFVELYTTLTSRVLQ